MPANTAVRSLPNAPDVNHERAANPLCFGELVALPASVPADVTVWRLDRREDNFVAPRTLLTADDWRELSRLRGDARERGFAVRGLLRAALTQAVEGVIAPEVWQFTRSTYGKLLLAPHLPALDFSISHAGLTSCIAISTSGRIGLDIEHCAVPNWHSLAGDFLLSTDRDMINRAPPAQRECAFSHAWTAKEAFAKLLGVGLAMSAPANDCGFGTRLATWQLESPSGALSISLAFDEPVERELKRA